MRASSTMPLLVVWMAVAASVGPVAAVEPPYEIERVGEGIYWVVRELGGANAMVIVNDRDCVVVDSHVSPAVARGTIAAIRSLTDRPVRYVVNTHWHTDHVVGNAAYLEAFPTSVEFIAHRTVREDIQNLAAAQLPAAIRYLREDLVTGDRMLAAGVDQDQRTLSDVQTERLRRFLDDQGRTIEELDASSFVLPDLAIDRELVLHRGERQIRILHLGRGHTRGDLVVYLPRERIVATGDLLTHPTLYVSRASRPVEWLESLRALAELDFAVAIPGHGTEALDRDYLELIIAVLGEVVSEVRRGVGEGRGFAEIEPRVSLAAVETDWVADDPGRREVFRAATEFVSDAVAVAYLEATGRLD